MLDRNKKTHLLCPSIDPSFGVGAFRAKSFFEYLQSSNYDISVKEVGRPGIFSILQLAAYILRNNKDQFICSVGPFHPYLSFLFANLFRKTDLIIDIRDPLFFNIRDSYGQQQTSKQSPRMLIKQIFSKGIESWMVKAAKQVIVCTPGLYKIYRETFSNAADKFVFLPNGHEVKEEELTGYCTNKELKEGTRIVCVGKFFSYGEANAIRTLKKIQSLMQERSILNYRLDIYGEDPRYLKIFIQKYPQFNFIFAEPPIPFEDVHSRLSSYDLAVLVLRNEDFDLGTKAYAYIASGLPIINTFKVGSNGFNFLKPYLLDSDLSFSVNDLNNFNRSELVKLFFEKENLFGVKPFDNI